MAAVVLLLAITGNAVFIADGLQQQVIERRRGYGLDINPHVAGYAALSDCCYLGHHIGITWPDGIQRGPYQVVDCAQANHRAYLDSIDFAVEVSESEWREYVNGDAGVSVWTWRDTRRLDRMGGRW